jgi:hypothetical protein
MPTELVLIRAVQTLAYLAGLFLIGQGVLYVLAGQRRDNNFFYGIFKVLTRPVMKLARWVSPAMIADRHVPLVACFIVFWVWAGSTILLIQYCVAHGMDVCRT